jgi:DNA invertase Pin-like site-specific DNA recombinase
MEKLAIYARVSTQDNQEFDRQISDLTKVILAEGYKDNQITIYSEKLSAYNKERPELIKLLENASDYKCIYVTEISRLGRNPSHTRQIIDELTDKKIPVYIQNINQKTIDKDGNRNSIMSIILQVLMEFAHSEAQTMQTRMKSGKIQAVKDKKVHGANLAFGYKNQDKMLVVDDDESAIIRMIFKLASDGLGTDLIAKYLNNDGIPTRRANTHKEKGFKIKGTDIIGDASNIKWTNNVIRQIIKNTIYKGQRKYKDETYDCPAIISEEQFKVCNDAISDRRTKRDSTYTYLLKNLMYCGVCGKKYMGIYQPTSKASKVYKCTSGIRDKGCCNSAPNLLYLESVFYHEFLSVDLTEYLDNPDEVKTMLEDDLNKINIEIQDIQNEKANKELEEKRILQLFAIGQYNFDRLNEMNEKVLNELNILKNKLQILKDKQLELKISLSNYNEETTSKDMLINAKDNRQELRNIYKQLIHKIIINKINDTYTLLTYYIKVKGVVLPNPLKIFINLKAARKNHITKEKDFKYFTMQSMENEVAYKDNILMVDVKDIEEEMNYWLNVGKLESPIIPFKIRNIPIQNRLIIGDSDL